MRVLLLGASGYTGRLVAAELDRRGVPFAVAGRHDDRLRTALEDLDTAADLATTPERRHADADDPASLDRAMADVDVVLTCAGPYQRLGPPVLEAALRAGCHYVDICGELPFIRWVYEQRTVAAEAAGVTVVTAAGFDFLPGDLLAHLAAAAVVDPDELHVTYVVDSPGLRPVLSAGSRRSAAGLIGRPMVALDRGVLVEEGLAEQRRLAWFPRPLGPRHAAGFPGAEPLTVPHHVPSVRMVRTYLAVPGWQAELMQLAGNVARWAPARRFVAGRAEGGGGGPAATRRAAVRWGCVAEAATGDEVARAWVSGTDVYGFTAVAAVAVVEAVLAGSVAPGVVPPADVGAPDTLLDRLAARSDLLWSVARPQPR